MEVVVVVGSPVAMLVGPSSLSSRVCELFLLLQSFSLSIFEILPLRDGLCVCVCVCVGASECVCAPVSALACVYICP